jgi:hypothetical protein
MTEIAKMSLGENKIPKAEKKETLWERIFPINPLYLIIPATFDNIGCTMMYIGLT